MIKALLLLVALVAVGVVADTLPSYKYAGVLRTATQAIPPTFTSAGVCAASTAGASEMVSFTVNITTAPASYFIQAMFDKNIVGGATVSIYSTYTAGTPCTGILVGGVARGGAAPHAHYAYRFTTNGVFTVVVSAPGPLGTGVDGVFAVNVVPANYWADSGASNLWWTIPDFSSGSCVDSSNGNTQYNVFSWVPQAASGWYDAYTIFRNVSDGSTTMSPILAVFSSTTGSAPGNLSVANAVFDPCMANDTTHKFELMATDDIGSAQNTMGLSYSSEDTIAVVARFMAVNTSTYFFVMGANQDQGSGTSFLRIEPTRFGTTSMTLDYLRPQLATSIATGDTCSADSPPGRPYYPYTFTPDVGQYVFVVDTGYSMFDTAGCLYQGNNSGAPPVGCPTDSSIQWITCVDTGDISPMSYYPLVPGVLYTAVVTTWTSSSASYEGLQFQIWAMSGTYLGPPVVAPVAPATPGTAPGTPGGTPGTSTPSSAASLAMSAILAFAALLALLF